MSDHSKKEFASALKWTWVIIVAAFAYNTVAPNYFFMKRGVTELRGNKVSGRLEELGENKWINISGN
jgi:hypothetical protein